MGMISTGHTENIAEKKKTKNQKLKDKRRKKKLLNQTNQNVEISSNEKCHGLAERGAYGGSAVERVLSNTVKETSHNGTLKRKRNSKRSSGSKNELEPMDQEHEDLDISKNGKVCNGAEAGLGVDDECLVKESPNVDNVFSNIDKEKSQSCGKRKRSNSKSMASNNDGQVISDQENKCLEISIDKKSCISVAKFCIKDVALNVEPLLQESAEVLEVSTKTVKEKMASEGKRKRKKKSKARNKVAKVMLDEEDKCLKISVDSKTCNAAAELPIIGVDSVGSRLQELPEVGEVSTEIAKERNPSQVKPKKKSKSRDKDGDTILDKEKKCLEIFVDRSCSSAPDSGINGENLAVKPLLQESEVEEVITDILQKEKTPEEKQRRKIKAYHRDECLKISGYKKSCITASDIVTKQKMPVEKQRRKIKSYYRDNNVKKVIPGEDVESLKISDDRKSCIAASEMAIEDVNLNVESLRPDYAVVNEASTEIVKGKTSPEGKQRQKTKLKTSNKNKVEVPIVDQQDELLVTSINVGNCCEETEMGTLQHVDSLLREEDNCPKISADKKSCIINDVDSNVESLLQDSAVADEASTEIVNEKKSAEGKKTKLKTRNKRKVEVPIIDQQGELLATSINDKSCKETEMDTLQGVDSRSKFPSDNVPSIVINEKVDLPNDFDELPQRAVTSRSRKILLILDINGLLADIVMPPPKDRKSDINMLGRAIFKRPYCDDFLNFCFDTFDVAIWSSRTKRVIDKVVDYLLGERRQKLLFCWDMSHTTKSNFKTLENRHKPLVCKGLSNLWEKRDPALPWEKGYYTESNTLLIDDSPYKSLLNPMHTAIFPQSFTYKDRDDTSLGPKGKLRVYLQDLAKTDDVRRYVEEHPFGQSAITEKSPSWDFYSKVLSSLLDGN